MIDQREVFDIDVVNWLIGASEHSGTDINWKYVEGDGGHGYWTAIIDRDGEFIELKLSSIRHVADQQIFLEFNTEFQGKVCIMEPIPSFIMRYGSKGDKELAQALKHLFNTVKIKYTDKEARNLKDIKARKQAIFKKLLGWF